MPAITEYVKENFLRAVLQGPPGSGKTCVSSQFPAPWIIDFDRNLGGPLRFLERHGLQKPLGYDIVSHDDDGKEVPLEDKDSTGRTIARADQFNRVNTILQRLQKDDNVKTIVFSSATKFVPILINATLRQQNKNNMEEYTAKGAGNDGRQFWAFFARNSAYFFEILAKMRKHIVLEAHEKTNKDANGSVVYPIKVNWPGQAGQIIGAYFTDVWRCETEPGVGLNARPKYVIRTEPSFQYELKNSLGLPTTFEYNWNTIQAALDKTGGSK